MGGHVIDDATYFYTVNPVGGYDMDEVLCCEQCIKNQDFVVVRQRMIDAGANELIDNTGSKE